MPTPTTQAQDAHHQVILADLLDDGARIVADLAREDSPAGSRAEAYDRAARGIRRTVILARHIAEHPIAVAAHPVATAKPPVTNHAVTNHAATTQTEPRAPKPATPRIDAPDPSDSPDDLDDLTADLTITTSDPAAAIADIRRDLGLAPHPTFTDAEHIDPDNDEELSPAVVERLAARLDALLATLPTQIPIRDG